MYGAVTGGSTESQQMTEDEVKVFNYLYATQGKEAAQEYYAYLQKDLNQRQRKADATRWSAYGKKNPVGGSVLSTVIAPLKIMSLMGQGTQYLATGEVDQNASYNRFSYGSNAIREGVTQDMSDAGAFVYSTGMSIADNLFRMVTSGGNSLVSGLISAGGVAADSVIEAKDRGLSDGQAMALGLISGALEAAVEQINIEEAFTPDKLKDGIAKFILKNAGAEASEEAITNIATTVADYIIAGDMNKLQMEMQAYMKQGLSQGEAAKKVFINKALEIGSDALAGGISGGVISGGNAAINGISNKVYKSKLKKQLAGQGLSQQNVADIIDAAGAGNADSAVKARAAAVQQQIQKGELFTQEQLGWMQEMKEQQGQQTDVQAAQREAAPAEQPATEVAGLSLPTLEENEQSTGAVSGTNDGRAGGERERVEQHWQEQRREYLLSQGLESNLTPEVTRSFNAKLRSAQDATEISGLLAGATDEQISSARRMGTLLGKLVIFYSQDEKNGYIENGNYDRAADSIQVNIQSKNPLGQIIGSELTHSIESAGSYAALMETVKQRVIQTGRSWDTMRQEKFAVYRRMDPNLRNVQPTAEIWNYIDQEILEQFVGENLLTSEEDIRTLVQEDLTLGKRIHQFLDNLLAKMGNKNAQERVFVWESRCRRICCPPLSTA